MVLILVDSEEEWVVMNECEFEEDYFYEVIVIYEGYIEVVYSYDNVKLGSSIIFIEYYCI